MKFISYAQNYEDVILNRALGHIEQGFYVDVGAQHPINDSVTKAFYDRGWAGINIEPVDEWFQLLETHRTRDQNIKAIASSRSGKSKFFSVGNTGLSTTNSKYASEYLREKLEVVETVVPKVTLNQLLSDAEFEQIHFLKVDVEGDEGKVLAGLDLRKYRPWIILIEAYKPRSTVPDFESWEGKLLDRNYTFVYDDGLNRFYVADEHPELKDAFARPPNVLDDFETYEVQWLRQNGDAWRAQCDAARAALDVLNMAESIASQSQAIVAGASRDAEISVQLHSAQEEISNQIEQSGQKVGNLQRDIHEIAGSLESRIETTDTKIAANLIELTERLGEMTAGRNAEIEDKISLLAHELDAAILERTANGFQSLSTQLATVADSHGNLLEQRLSSLITEIDAAVVPKTVDGFQNLSKQLLSISDDHDKSLDAKLAKMIAELEVSVGSRTADSIDTVLEGVKAVVHAQEKQLHSNMQSLAGDLISGIERSRLSSTAEVIGKVDDHSRRLQAVAKKEITGRLVRLETLLNDKGTVLEGKVEETNAKYATQLTNLLAEIKNSISERSTAVDRSLKTVDERIGGLNTRIEQDINSLQRNHAESIEYFDRIDSQLSVNVMGLRNSLNELSEKQVQELSRVTKRLYDVEKELRISKREFWDAEMQLISLQRQLKSAGDQISSLATELGDREREILLANDEIAEREGLIGSLQTQNIELESELNNAHQKAFLLASDIDDLSKSFEHLRANRSKLELSLSQMNSELENERSENLARSKSVERLSTELATTRDEVVSTRLRLKDELAENESLKRHVDLMSQSLSWRITAPLRKANHGLSRATAFLSDTVTGGIKLVATNKTIYQLGSKTIRREGRLRRYLSRTLYPDMHVDGETSTIDHSGPYGRIESPEGPADLLSIAALAPSAVGQVLSVIARLEESNSTNQTNTQTK